MRSSLWIAALAVGLLPAAALADPGAAGIPSQVSALALPVVGADAALDAGSGATPVTAALATPFVGGIRYRPRGYGYRDRGYAMPTVAQLHAGFMDPTDNFSTGFNGGFRVGPMVTPNLQLGVGLDWWHKSSSDLMSIDVGSLPGGGSATRQLELSRTSADLLPIMAFAQLSGDENMSIIPYAGAGVGYEVLYLSADDFTTNTSFNATYGGFGWQGWAGLAVPLSGRTRVSGEAFYNGSQVGRDVDVTLSDGTPATVREVVKMDGVGARFGVSWGF